MSLYSGGLIIGRIFTSEISGAYFREDLSFIYLFIYLFILLLLFFWGGGRAGGGGLIIGIFRYL